MELALITLLLIKHIIADYFMQYSWMIRDKGTYGAWGGIAHSGWHAILTLLVLSIFNLPLVWIILMSIFDGVVHYHVDYVKSNIWKTKGYTPANQMYWITHGVDQLLHLLTYVAIVALCV
tara:strand:+ start:3655 stop:4014 length:360 start_codon:yes stop_codon:yes gene_type:complete